jgi:hypothetical protein
MEDTVKHRILTALILISLAISSGWSRDCESLLASNLTQIGDTGLEYGVELRASYYLVKYGDTLDKILLPSAAFMTQYQASNGWFFQFEGLLRYKDLIPSRECECEGNGHLAFEAPSVWFSRNRYASRTGVADGGDGNHMGSGCDGECKYSQEGLYFNVRQAWAEIPVEDRLLLKAGRRNLAFGNALALDNWFDSVELEMDLGKLDLSLFGGVLAKDVARGTSSCQHEIVYENLLCWTKICQADYGEHQILGASISLNLLKDHKQNVLLMRQEAPGDDRDADIASVYMNGRLVSTLKYFVEGAYERYRTSTGGVNTYGLSGILRGYVRNDKVGMLQFGLGYLYGSESDGLPFAPIYGSLWLGERQRYWVKNGNIGYLQTKFSPMNSKHLNLSASYFHQLSKEDSLSESDELDLGIDLKLTDSKKIGLVYSLTNLADSSERKSQIKLETRLVF